MKFVLLTLGRLAMFGGALFYFGSALIDRRRFNPSEIAAANAAGPGWRMILFTWITVAGAATMTLARAFFVMLLALLFVCAAPIAYAATGDVGVPLSATVIASAYAVTGGIDMPWGQYLVQAVGPFTPLLVALAVAYIIKQLPPVARFLLPDAAIHDAVMAAISDLEGLVAGQTYTVPVTNQIIVAALVRVKANWPLVVIWLGKTVEPRIIAYLQSRGMVPADASAATLGAGK